ncbi:rod shape-determining protein [Microgenomates group bacterium RBG_16_45_19]|nr:MAG: rod shape-determining protein [Microgenomates group bacterium RBG_16_45_19]
MWIKRLGIDLGTANSLVWLAGEGIVLNEPTVVAVSLREKKVLAVGREAKEMLGRTPGGIVATRPMREGVIADYVVTEAMLRFFIQKVMGRNYWLKPEVMICVPAGCTQVERRAVLDATLSAGARAAYLIDEPLAAAIGANIPIAEASGNMILDVGGGAAETAVISLGGVVIARSVRVGGNKIDEAIADWVRKKYNLVIGEQTAEMVKLKIGSATELKPEQKIEVRGRDTVSGLPREINLSSTDITAAVNKPLSQIVGLVKSVLEEIPPELSSDIIDKGIVLSGGSSQLINFHVMLTQETGVPCHVCEEPMLAVVKGTGIALENLDLYKRSISRRR